MVDGSEPDPYFTSIKAKSEKRKPVEAIQDGVIQAVAKYKTDIDNADFIYSVSVAKAIPPWHRTRQQSLNSTSKRSHSCLATTFP